MKSLVGRNIIKSRIYDLVRPAEDSAGMNSVLISAGSNDVTANIGAGVRFDGEFSSYQVRCVLPTNFLANGCAAKVCFEGWEKVQYVAVGYTSGKNFVHVKVPNPRQGVFFEMSCCHLDAIFKLQNGWGGIAADNMSDLRIYIKGKPCEDGGGIIRGEQIAFWLEQDYFAPSDMSVIACNDNLLATMLAYWKRCFGFWERQADEYLKAGSYPVYGDLNLEWGVLDDLPRLLKTNNTYRFSWHAMHATQILLTSYLERGDAQSLCAARELVEKWIGNSFLKPDSDQKYAWYDHGVAERLMALSAVWQLGLKLKFDNRFMLRLEYAVFKHAQLLETEAFYASHQPYRYHNHAWFQDIALISTAICLRHLDVAEHWLDRGLERLKDQLEKLIYRESGYAIFVENSIGYHQGIHRLVGFAGELEQLAGRGQAISDIASELSAWADAFRYPDGRFPAQGDTFRRANPLSRNEVSLPEAWQPEVLELPGAGYAVIKGGVATMPWMLGMLATNRNSTHKHEDDLSIFLWLDGVEWLIDPSFCSHEYKEEIPAYLRSARSHNMLYVEGAEYRFDPSPDRTWLEVEKVAEERALRVNISGHNRSCLGFDISRRLSCAEIQGTPTIVCVDRFVGSIDQAEAQSQLHNDLKGVLSFHLGDGVQVQSTSTDDQQLRYELVHPASSRILVLSIRLADTADTHHVQLEPSVCGLGFMEHIATQAIRVTLPNSIECHWSIDVR